MKSTVIMGIENIFIRYSFIYMRTILELFLDIYQYEGENMEINHLN